MSKEYERIRIEVSKRYKSEIKELKETLGNTLRELQTLKEENEYLNSEVKKLKSENAKLKFLSGNPQNEVTDSALHLLTEVMQSANDTYLQR